MAIPLLLPIDLHPSSPAHTMTTRHVQVRLVRVMLELGAAVTASIGWKTLSHFHQLNYLGNSIAASVAVALGGDEIR